MSGDGGDELFMGYGHYNLYKRLKKIYNVVPSIGRNLLSSLLYMRKGKFERGSRLFKLKNDDNLMVRIWAEEQYMFTEPEISELLGESYSHQSLMPKWENINSMPIDDFEKISLFDYSQYLSHNLMYKMDSASMANSLEVRNPYLDYRVVELAMNMPLSCKINNGEQKYLMKKLLERFLPKHLVYRTKWGFPAPVGDWLYKELKHLPDIWLNEDRIRKQGIFNPKEVRKWVTTFQSGKHYHYKRLWSLIIFQMWHQEYIDN
jgi:asparagine synthase (glutamine-hydrolysing)